MVLSRSGPTSLAAIKVISELRDRSIMVITPTCNVSSVESVSHVLQKHRMSLPLIKGAINATIALNVGSKHIETLYYVLIPARMPSSII